MKVRELIALLRECDQDMPVMLETTPGGNTVLMRPEFIRAGEWFEFEGGEVYGPHVERRGGIPPSAVKCLWFFA
jgi:hypothetical protein